MYPTKQVQTRPTKTQLHSQTQIFVNPLFTILTHQSPNLFLFPPPSFSISCRVVGLKTCIAERFPGCRATTPLRSGQNLKKAYRLSGNRITQIWWFRTSFSHIFRMKMAITGYTLQKTPIWATHQVAVSPLPEPLEVEVACGGVA